MTSKEKIETAWELVNSKHIETNDEIQLVRFAVRMARELIERDTPMKVIKTPDWYYHCPMCEEEVDVSNTAYECRQIYRYCYHCGQRLDWSGRK